MPALGLQLSHTPHLDPMALDSANTRKVEVEGEGGEEAQGQRRILAEVVGKLQEEGKVLSKAKAMCTLGQVSNNDHCQGGTLECAVVPAMTSAGLHSALIVYVHHKHIAAT